MADGHCVWHLGKAIGGTSSIDNLAYVRGMYIIMRLTQSDFKAKRRTRAELALYYI